MAFFYPEPSRTFSEYLLIPNLTSKTGSRGLGEPGDHAGTAPQGGDSLLSGSMCLLLRPSCSPCPTTRWRSPLPGPGGISFIFTSQPVESQAAMVERVKKFKAGFVASDSNIRPEATLEDVLTLRERTGHTTMAVTEDGTPTGKLVGILTSRDYRLSTTPRNARVSALMTRFDDLVYGQGGPHPLRGERPDLEAQAELPAR